MKLITTVSLLIASINANADYGTCAFECQAHYDGMTCIARDGEARDRCERNDQVKYQHCMNTCQAEYSNGSPNPNPQYNNGYPSYPRY